MAKLCKHLVVSEETFNKVISIKARLQLDNPLDRITLNKAVELIVQHYAEFLAVKPEEEKKTEV
jgi:hypothetical protein